MTIKLTVKTMKNKYNSQKKKINKVKKKKVYLNNKPSNERANTLNQKINMKIQNSK